LAEGVVPVSAPGLVQLTTRRKRKRRKREEPSVIVTLSNLKHRFLN